MSVAKEDLEQQDIQVTSLGHLQPNITSLFSFLPHVSPLMEWNIAIS